MKPHGTAFSDTTDGFCRVGLKGVLAAWQFGKSVGFGDARSWIVEAPCIYNDLESQNKIKLAWPSGHS